MTLTSGAARQVGSRRQRRLPRRFSGSKVEHELSMLLDISYEVTSTLDLQTVIARIFTHVQKVIGYSGALLCAYREPILTALDYRGPAPVERILAHEIELDESPGFRAVIESKSPVIIPDLQGDGLLPEAYRTRASQRILQSLPGSRSWLGAPLINKGEVIGALRLDHAEPNYYTARHAKLVMILANQAAVAMENARLYAEAQALAVLSERQRLAREVHDSIVQDVYGVIWQIHTARQVLRAEDAPAISALGRAVDLARASLYNLRALIFELRPEMIERVGLVGMLTQHARALQTDYRVDVSLEIEGEPEINLRVKEALFRVAHEAMLNAVKHSRAPRVSVHLHNERESVVLEVADDGVGFDPGGQFPGHLGLVSMQERVAQAGGTLQIVSSPSGGTQVQVSVPHSRPPL